MRHCVAGAAVAELGWAGGSEHVVPDACVPLDETALAVKGAALECNLRSGEGTARHEQREGADKRARYLVRPIILRNDCKKPFGEKS